MTSKASGLNKKQILLMKYVQAINNPALITVKINAALEVMMPAGISLIAVRGFLASMLLSSHLLNAMAALRANIMHNTTKINSRQ